MKHILKLRAGHYVHLDSYPETHETRGSQALVLVLSIIISALTVGALIGADLTQTQHEINSYGHRNSR